MSLWKLAICSLALAAGLESWAVGQETDNRLRIGDAAGKVIVPTNQVLSPAGKQVTFSGRPTDLALSPDGKWLGVLDRNHVAIINPESGEIASRVPHGSGSYAGVLFTADSKQLLASSNKGSIGVFDVSADGKLSASKPIALPLNKNARGENVANSETGPQSPNKSANAPGADSKNALPVGLALDADGKTLWAVLNLRNTLARIDLAEGKVLREIPVGNAPYGVALVGGKAYVSNWAGRHPGANDITGPSGAGTPVRVDPKRNIASDGSVSVVDLKAGKELKQILVGLHPCAIASTPDGKHVIVANANSDTLSVIATESDKVIETISTRPAEKLLFGSSPNALAISSDSKAIFVSNGTNNAIALIEFSPGRSLLLGCVPTGWYPAGIVLDEKRKSLYVANIKGTGSRNTDWKGSRKVNGKLVSGYNSHDHSGTVSLIPLPRDADEIQKHMVTVLANNRHTESISALAPPRKDAKPLPVPERHGEPSVFKHVLYIIKENRTYDQVFGDIERGEGDPDLCIYGRDVTPNHHKLVDEFVLLDNFYCSGVLSADGHQWTNEAYVTTYLERAFGGFPRSYPYWGGDAMAYASSGFIWDNVLEHKKSLRVYGEFVEATVKWKDGREGRPKFLDCYRDFMDKKGEIDIKATAAIKTLEPYLCPTVVGFPLVVPDVHRADQFIRERKDFEAKGELPNFMIMLLPNDHTSGTRPDSPTPAACVADNDLALGQIVEAVSHSKFWKETCIFVVQDDPQNGFDHIDGHRTVALVISPYTKRKALDSTNYNQTSMVRTMELILGLPPMNQLDASATPMASCFTDIADVAPYKSVPNLIPLDQMNPKLSSIKDPRQRHWAEVSLKLPLDDVDEADENTFNRILWHAARGRDDTYPAWAVLEEEDD
jgi:YVTN family beta-propeller protein